MVNETGKHKGTDYRVEELIDGKTRLTRRSPFSGRLSEMTFDIPASRFLAYYGGADLIQNIFPDLDSDLREFVMTGILPSEWPEEL